MEKPETAAARAGFDEYSRMLFEEATDGVFVASPDGEYLEVNRSGHQMLGYEHGELIGKHIADLMLTADLPLLQESMSHLARGGKQTQTWPMRRKDGSVVEFEVSAQKLSNGALLGAVRDLGARAANERKIQASEAKLRSILETAPDIIMTVDRAGAIRFINRTNPPLSVEQVLGMSCLDFVPAEGRSRVQAALEHVFSTRGFDAYEVQGPPGLDGQRGWSSVRVGPLIERDEVIGATFCATDITERKRDEGKTRELFERLHKIASQVPGVVYQFKQRPDGSSCFPYASERIRDIYRVTPEEVREDASKVFSVLHPDDYAGIVESIQQSAATMKPWQYEYRARFPDGDVRWLFGNSVPERQTDGSILWHGFITDVTHQKELEVARAKLEEQLMRSQRMESVGQLAGGVAHDFNNLLTAVIAFVELAKVDLRNQAQVAEYLERILEAGKRGAVLTQQLLAFARKRVIQPEQVDLNAIMTRMRPMISHVVGEHIEVVLSLALNLGLVKVDVGSLEQVIMNLIVNARDAMPSGGRLLLESSNAAHHEPDGSVHLEIEQGDYVVLSVSDTGLGMSPEVRSHVFEPFFTTKPQGEGTGLGLAMCHGIVKQAGGAISFYSELGRGTSFNVHLPRLQAARASLSASTEPNKPTTAGGSETLLIVEDEPMILRVAELALNRLGYRTLCAENGVKALELVKSLPETIHLVITDVVMPRMSGLELAKRIEQLRPGIKILYTSGCAERAIADGGVLQEGLLFIQKPYTLSALGARVREVLDG